jgi:hypothetical protein
MIGGTMSMFIVTADMKAERWRTPLQVMGRGTPAAAGTGESIEPNDFLE